MTRPTKQELLDDENDRDENDFDEIDYSDDDDNLSEEAFYQEYGYSRGSDMDDMISSGLSASEFHDDDYSDDEREEWNDRDGL